MLQLRITPENEKDSLDTHIVMSIIFTMCLQREKEGYKYWALDKDNIVTKYNIERYFSGVTITETPNMLEIEWT